MFRLAIKYTVDRSIRKCVYVHCAPQPLSLVDNESCQTYIGIPREDAAFFSRTVTLK